MSINKKEKETNEPEWDLVFKSILEKNGVDGNRLMITNQEFSQFWETCCWLSVKTWWESRGASFYK